MVIAYPYGLSPFSVLDEEAQEGGKTLLVSEHRE